MQSRSAPRRRPGLAAIVVIAAAALLSACATVGGAGACGNGQHDPLEPLNRHIFAFDLALDHAVIKPVAKAYRSLLPAFVRDAIRAVVDNLKEPLVFVNDLLQGRGEAAGITAKRFVINSTVGVAGLNDRATDFGLPRQSGDFGQTLYAWGFGDGPYLVLPFFGPSNLRDTLGLGVDLYASPLGQVGSADVQRDLSISTGVADGIDLRSRNIESMDELERSSLDFYAYLRSVTRQQRQSILREAKQPGATEPAPGEELIDPGAPAPPVPIKVPDAALDRSQAGATAPAGPCER